MLKWVLWSFVPIIVGGFVSAALLPKNRGKKEPTEEFTVQYSTKMKVVLAAAMIGMALVAVMNYIQDPETFSELAFFYLCYVLFWGMLLALLALFCTRTVNFDKGVVTVTNLRKNKTFMISEIKHMDVCKTDVKLYGSRNGKDEELLCSMGIMMENLDYFFAWANARNNIRVTVEGKEMKKKAKPN